MTVCTQTTTCSKQVNNESETSQNSFLELGHFEFFVKQVTGLEQKNLNTYRLYSSFYFNCLEALNRFLSSQATRDEHMRCVSNGLMSPPQVGVCTAPYREQIQCVWMFIFSDSHPAHVRLLCHWRESSCSSTHWVLYKSLFLNTEQRKVCALMIYV